MRKLYILSLLIITMHHTEALGKDHTIARSPFTKVNLGPGGHAPARVIRPFVPGVHNARRWQKAEEWYEEDCKTIYVCAPGQQFWYC